MELMINAAAALFVLGGAALLLAVFMPARAFLRVGARSITVLLIIGGGALYLSDQPYAHWPLIAHGLSLLVGHHIVRRAARLNISREIALTALAITFGFPLLGLLAWVAAEAAVKAKWRTAQLRA